MSVPCDIPRIVIAATQSGSGKTTLVAGILAALRARRLTVQAYKIGPDYIDPGYHALASGRHVHNLDTWLVPPERLCEIFARSASQTDIAIIEGVMGLYDGGRNGVSSTAEIAKLLEAPVILVIDAKSMGASAAAIALGFRSYDPKVKLSGVLLNRIGSPTHAAMIREALSGIDMPLFGALRRDAALSMPERHLGLVPTTENREEALIQRLGEAVDSQVDLDGILALAKSAPPLSLPQSETENGPACSASAPICRIAVARDEAFSFYYPESLHALEDFGAKCIFFSPLKDAELPHVDGLILGGGFPEMFAAELGKNQSMQQSIQHAADSGMPVYAECGGFMYLMRELVDFNGQAHPMLGLFPGKVQMQERLQMVGYVEAELLQDTILGQKGDKLRGHEFHFSSESGNAPDVSRAFRFTRMRNGAEYLAGYANGNLLGSYLHLHFAGCRKAAQTFVERCVAYRKNHSHP